MLNNYNFVLKTQMGSSMEASKKFAVVKIVLYLSYCATAFQGQTTAHTKNNQCLGGCYCTTKNISHLQVLQVHIGTYLRKTQTNSKHLNFVRISEY